jgi:fermentation-respiration switch protein FrsA (DUF1100 family)
MRSTAGPGRVGRAASWMVAATLVAACAACAHPVTRPLPLELVREELIESDDQESLYEVTFKDPSGIEVQAYRRVPTRPAPEPTWGVVLVAGRETGREAAAVLPGPIEGTVLAVEYAGELPDVFAAAPALRRLPAIQREARRMPGLLRGAAHHLAGRPEVDPGRVALIGVSFGVPFAAAAGRDPVFSAVALIHGGGDLARILDHNLEIRSPVIRRLVAEYGAHVFRELEPLRHVGGIAPTPLLLINGIHDDMVPEESARLLREHAREPVEHLWLPHGHLMPWDTALMRELTAHTRAHFEILQD